MVETRLFDQDPLAGPGGPLAVGHQIDTVPRPRVDVGDRNGGSFNIDIAYGSLQTGTYAIINAASDRVVMLSSEERGGILVGGRITQQRTDNHIKWKVTKFPNETFTIIQETYNLSASPSTPINTLSEKDQDSPVVAQASPVRWYIREGRRPGYYILYASAESALYWYLKDGQPNTAVTLSLMTNDTPTLPSQFQWNFCPLGGDAVPIFDFKLRLNCSPGGDPRSSSFVEYPLSIDFRQDFTLLAWAFCEDRSQWRSILSFESPQVSTSLLSLALPPRSEPNVIHLAYMTSMQASHLKGLQGALEVPFPNLWFHVAVVFKTGTFGSDTFTIYVNGVEDATLIVDQGIFRAKDINIVLGSRKFMNGPASQWSGSIENVRVHQAAITEEQINAHLAEGSLPRIRALRTSTCQWPAIDPVTSPLGDARLSDHDGDAEQPWMS